MPWDVLTQKSSLPPRQQDDALNGPALVPPYGTVANLDNPPNGDTLARVVIGICFGIVLLAVLLRAYVKIFVFRKVFLEDVLAFIGFVMTVAYYVCCLRVLHQVGFFVHQWNLSVLELYEALYVGNMASSFYEVGISALKIAILLEWNKTFAPNRSPKYFYWTCYVLIWVTVSYYVIAVTSSNIVCFPMPGNSTRLDLNICLNKGTAEAVSASLNLVSHILIFALPQTVIWKLRTTTKKKIGVSLAFAIIGILVVLTGVCRLIATIEYFTSTDTIFVGSRVFLWCVVELTFVILVFCVPIIPKIFGEGTRASKILAMLRSWPRLLSRPFRANKNPTQVDIEHNDTTSGDTYQRIEEIRNLPLKNLENWDGHRDIYLGTPSNQ